MVVEERGYRRRKYDAKPNAQSGCTTKPLYRQYNPTTEDHQYGLTMPESTGVNGKDGYFYEGVAAHVFPPQ